MLNEVTWSKLESLEVSDFNGTGSIAILFSNTQQFTENNELDNVQLVYNATGVAFQDNCTGNSGCPSFAYNHFYHVDASIVSGGTGFLLQNDASLNGSDLEMRCRGGGTGNITCLSLTGTSSINLASLKIGGENGGTNTGISTTTNTLFAPVNLYEQWNAGTWSDSISGRFIAYIYTPPNVGHIIGAAQGLSVGNTTHQYLATLDTTLLTTSNQSYTFPNASGTFMISGAAPTVSSGFGTSPAVGVNNGTAVFTVNVGSGGTATAGILAMPAAANGWSCAVDDLTAAAANVAYNTRQTASSTTTVTVQNQTTSTGTPIAWGANDILRMSCLPY
jgi:hypothetical protein